MTNTPPVRELFCDFLKYLNGTFPDPQNGMQEGAGQEVHGRPHLHPEEGVQRFPKDRLHQRPHQRAQEDSQESLLLGKLSCFCINWQAKCPFANS